MKGFTLKTVKKIKRRRLVSSDDSNILLKFIDMLRGHYLNEFGYSFRIINGSIYAFSGKFYQSDWDFIHGMIVGYNSAYDADVLKYNTTVLKMVSSL